MPGVAYDPFKIYNYGDPELAQRTGIESITGQVQDYASIKAQYAGTDGGFKDPEFPHNDTSIGKAGVDSANPDAVLNTKPIIWLRPQDAFKNYIVHCGGRWTYPYENYTAKFTCGGISRFDIDQGGIGNCFFVASLAAIATNDKLIEWFCPSDNQDDQGAGVYHFRFWRSGAYIDVVVDEYIPFILHDPQNNGIIPYAARLSATGLTVEYWVQLAEKAYAKLDGGYGQQAGGGFELKALQDVTGGMSESYKFNSQANIPADLHDNIQKALTKEYSIIALGCKSVYGGENPDPVKDAVGLKYPHAYTVTRADSVKKSSGYRSTEVKLLRIRNPHGCNEFTGPWSDKSSVWNQVSAEEKARLGYEVKNDGEFWMAFTDALKYFEGVSIVSPTTMYKEKFSNPPFVYVSYDGTFGSRTGDNYTIQASSSDLNPNGEAVIAADVTAKLTGEDRLRYLMSLELVPAKEENPSYPPELEAQVKQALAQYRGRPFSFDYLGKTYRFNVQPEPLPKAEGVEEVQSMGGISLGAAWKVPPGEYKINVRSPDPFGYNLRVLYFKGA